MSKCSLGIIHGPGEPKASGLNLQVSEGQTCDQGYNHALETEECCFRKFHQLSEVKVKDRAQAEENFKLPYASVLCDFGYEHQGCSVGEFHKPGDKRSPSTHAFSAAGSQDHPVRRPMRMNGAEKAQPPMKVCDEGFEHRRCSLNQYHHGEPSKEDRERTERLCEEYGIPRKPPQIPKKSRRRRYSRRKKLEADPVKIPRQTCDQGYAHAIRCRYSTVHASTDRRPSKRKHRSFADLEPEDSRLNRRRPPRAMDKRKVRSRGRSPAYERERRLERILAAREDPAVTCEQGFVHNVSGDARDSRMCALGVRHPPSSQHPTPALDTRSVSTRAHTVCNQGCRHRNVG